MANRVKRGRTLPFSVGNQRASMIFVYNERDYKSKEKMMTFEEILPGLKAKKKYVRTGWGGAENYVQPF